MLHCANLLVSNDERGQARCPSAQKSGRRPAANRDDDKKHDNHLKGGALPLLRKTVTDTAACKETPKHAFQEKTTKPRLMVAATTKGMTVNWHNTQWLTWKEEASKWEWWG